MMRVATAGTSEHRSAVLPGVLAAALAAALLVIGCTPGEPADGPDAGGDVGDSIAPGQTRLSVEFDSREPIPGEVGGQWNATVTHAHVDLSDLRVIADSGVVSHAALSLDWNAELAPAPLVFEQVPPGIYSQLAASIDGYGLRGTLVVDVDEVAFEISDTPQPSVHLGVNLHGLEIVAGDDVTVSVELDFEKLIGQISWNDVVPDGDGVLRVDADSAQIEAVRDELDDIFGDDD